MIDIIDTQKTELQALNQRLDFVQKLLGKQSFQRALGILNVLIEDYPENERAWYMRAVCFRYLNEYDAALACIDRLLALTPEYGRAYQEQGHVYKALQQNDKALQAYEQAIQQNPSLLASWQSMALLYQAQSNQLAAANANQQVQRLMSLPRELLSVSSMLHEGKLYKAEKLCRHYLQKHPHHIEAMRLLAQIGMRLYVLDDAEFLLDSCLNFDPNNHLARLDYISVLHKRQKFEQALEQAEWLRNQQPGNPSYETAYASECVATGRFTAALDIYDNILKQFPQNHHIHLVKGHALKTVGQQQRAVESYRSAYRSKKNFGDAFWSLANLKTYQFNDEEIQQMQEQLQHRHTGLVDRYHMCFALGKALEDKAEYKLSFDYYQQGNQLKQAELRYSADRMERDFELQKTVCTRDFFDARIAYGDPAPDPIFIVGLPRAGSTLIEQVLASHSQVDGTLELPNILALVHRLSGRHQLQDEPRYPAVLKDLSADQFASFGQAYLEDTKIHRQGAAFFIDKMPNNFRHIGLIHLILPNAKIIDARRHPMACCFSGFKQLFAEGQEFTYGQEAIGRYYKAYTELMTYWDEVLPGKVLRVQYEDMVNDIESQLDRILNFLGLPFEEACLNFHKNKRSVRTASSEQVRQPIFQSGLDYWRHYEPYLSELKQALGECLTDAA